jgi:O-antigen/teichoic acid export membrane protein
MEDNIGNKSVSRRILIGLSWTAIGFLISKAFSFGAAVYLSRMMGKHVYGELGMVQNTVGVLGLFAGAGMGLVTTRFISACRIRERGRIGKILGIVVLASSISTLVVVALIYLAAEHLSVKVLNNKDLGEPLRIGCFLLVSNVCFEVLAGILSGFEDFKSCSIAEIIRGVLIFPAAVLLTPIQGLDGAVAAFALASSAGAVYLLQRARSIVAKNCLKFEIRGAVGEIGILVRYALPTVLSSALPVPALWYATVLLARMPNGYSELGVYNAASQFRMLIMVIPVLLSRVLVPLLAHEHGESNDAAYHRAIEGTQYATMVVLLPVTLGLVFISEEVMGFFGEDFRKGARVMVFLTAGTAVSAIGAVIGSAVIATGHMWAGAVQNGIWAGSYLLFVLLQYRIMGALALADSFLFSHILLLTCTLVYLLRRHLLSRRCQET